MWHPQATNNGMKKIESKDVIKNLALRSLQEATLCSKFIYN